MLHKVFLARVADVFSKLKQKDKRVLFMIKARLLVDKKQLYYFKVWQANVVRHDLKGTCSSLGLSLQTQKHLCLRVLNKVFKRHLQKVFWAWKEQPKVQSLP